MAFTQTQLDALETAIASGTLEVKTGDKSVRYQSTSDMIKARDLIRDQLNSTSATQKSRATFASNAQGLNDINHQKSLL
ncbi:MAG: phage head-tail joining protein [Flammeovirgaceae bacterium]